MNRKIAVALGIVTASIGCLLAFCKTPSYRGPVMPLNAAEHALSQRLQAHVQKLAGDIGARSLTSAPGGLERAAGYIEEQLSASGCAPTRQTFSVSGYLRDGLFGASHATQSTSNIIAELPGTTKAQEIVVIGAHYDSVLDCPAANDNGSGVAALLEIAKALAKEKFSRTVRFVAFTNEEPPFFRTDDMGSHRYAQSCKERGDRVVSMISLETMGFYSDKPNSQQFPAAPLAAIYPTTGNFIAFVGNLDSQPLLARCSKSFNAAVMFPSEVLATPAEVPGIDFSDHLSFWRAGYPGIMVTDTAPYRYPHYHKGDDTPDKLNYEHLARVTSGMTQVVRDLAAEN